MSKLTYTQKYWTRIFCIQWSAIFMYIYWTSLCFNLGGWENALVVLEN